MRAALVLWTGTIIAEAVVLRPPAPATTPPPAAGTKWEELGAGCCPTFGMRSLFDGVVGSLQQCKDLCTSFPTCGFVFHGWNSTSSTRCSVLPRTAYCPKLHAGPQDCGSGGDSGVRAYRFVSVEESSPTLPSIVSSAAGWLEDVLRPSAPVQLSRSSSSTSRCDLAAGYFSADLTTGCCGNAQLLSQRGLAFYGLSVPCRWGSKCDEGKPSAAAEDTALKGLCAESTCLPSLVNAVRSSWIASFAADALGGVCSGGPGSSSAKVDAVFLTVRRQTSTRRKIASATHSSSFSNQSSGSGGTSGAALTMQALLRNNSGSQGEAGEVTTRLSGRRRRHGDVEEHNGPPRPEEIGCFPGESVVHTYAEGEEEQRRMDSLQKGDLILVERDGYLVREAVLSFLHRLPSASGAFVEVRHERGLFSATSSHIVPVMSADRQVDQRFVGGLRPGDRLLGAGLGDNASAPVEKLTVLSVRHKVAKAGLWAPLTAAGTVVVDGVVASAYASTSEELPLPHAVAHVMLFLPRVLEQTFASMGIACSSRDAGAGTTDEGLHPFLKVLVKQTPLVKLLMMTTAL
eukprot:TRINITY_DN112798_c0_g1_i1.p1 TRINITY_DN112798_c0_g1~~TRINITY_DN112798_c0_g1_i1.p1  ORF type:complete len:572 (-),score=105.50 TRINITY_DN112798_c0_g1_i1:367-2082(-)